jgi:hypothetical protein
MISCQAVVFAHLPSSFWMLSLLLMLLWHIETLSFQFMCPESAAKWILKVLWAPNKPISDAKAFWCCDMVAACVMQEIIYEIHLGQMLFGSLWQQHDRMCCWLFIRILSTSTVKMFDKSWINETFSLMNYSWFDLAACSMTRSERRDVNCCPWWSLMP